jgi:hypothetical protein
MIACMGGFCESRAKCLHYHQTSIELLTERLCGKTEEPEMGAGRSVWHERRYVPLRQENRRRDSELSDNPRHDDIGLATDLGSCAGVCQ